jgi:NADH-quinone oxidoreductase subunit C
MSDHLLLTTKIFVERYAAQTNTFRDELSLTIAPQYIVEACRTLHNECHFEVLSAQTAVDYWPELNPRFHVVYHFYSYQENLRLSIRVPLDGNAPSLPTIEGVYPNANWFERELWDMFGIHFENHSDLRRILMPHDWEGHPLRKDYPLAYEEVQFTFNYNEIDQRKPYAKKKPIK